MNDLTGVFPEFALKITLTAGVPGATILSIFLLSTIVLCLKQQGKAIGPYLYLTVPLLLAGLGGGAWVNEHLLKPRLDTPRPNISYLASTPPEAPLLGLSTDTYYALPDKQARREHLQSVLQSDAGRSLRISDSIREHWIFQDGFGFPSGHSFAAAFITVFFLVTGLSLCRGWYRWFYYLLLPWGLGVGYSRLFLGVHSLTDVLVGGLIGSLLGLLVLFISRRILQATDSGKT